MDGYIWTDGYIQLYMYRRMDGTDGGMYGTVGTDGRMGGWKDVHVWVDIWMEKRRKVRWIGRYKWIGLYGRIYKRIYGRIDGWDGRQTDIEIGIIK